MCVYVYIYRCIFSVLSRVEIVFQGKITAQGKLLQQDTFFVSEQDSGVLSRARERRVFLFEQLVIFSEPIDKKRGFSLPGYTFKNSIKVSESNTAFVRPSAKRPPSLTCCCVICRCRSAAWVWRSTRRGTPAA